MVEISGEDSGDLCVACRGHSTPQADEMSPLEHPRFTQPVTVEAEFAETCGGAQALAETIAATIGDPASAVLPMRFVFSRGWGEGYQLHVAHVGRRGDSVIVRRFRRNDPVVSRLRHPRERRPSTVATDGTGDGDAA